MIPTAPGEDVSAEELDRRVRGWRSSRDPRALWPGLDERRLQAAADAIGGVVPALLLGEPRSLGAVEGDDPYALGVAGLLTGMGPLLGFWVERGQLTVSAPAAAVLGRHLAQGRARVDRVSRGLRPVLEALAAAGIAPTVVKGMHTAYSYFPEPGTRPASDADIIVAPDAIPRAEAVLREAGFTPNVVVHRPYKRDWFPPDDDPRLHSVELFDARERWKLELHSGVIFGRLSGRRFALLENDGGTIPWTCLGAVARVPAPAPLVALLALHASGELDLRRLLRLAELSLVIEHESRRGALDWELVVSILDRARATGFAYPAFALTDRMRPGLVDPELLSRARRQASLVARAVTGRFTPTSPILPDQVVVAERLIWVRGPRDLLRVAASWLRPEPGTDWRGKLESYHRRLRLLLGGHVSYGGLKGKG